MPELSPQRIDTLKYILIAIIIVSLVFVIDKRDGDAYEGITFLEHTDQYQYLNMSENGIFDNPNLVSPMAYRFGVTSIAASIAYLTSLSIIDSYHLISVVSSVLQLWLVFMLANFFTMNKLKSLFITLIVAFSYFNLRFILFHFIVPDPLAYPIMAIVFILIFRRNLLSAALISIIGLTIREFFIAPILTIILIYIEEHKKHRLTDLIVIIGLTLLVIILPRTIIPISKSYQYINTQNYQSRIIGALRDTFRMINVALAIMGYMLPTILLLTLKRGLVLLYEHRLKLFVLAPYTLVVFGLTIYGGTDLGRFATYLFIPQIVCLSLILNEEVQLWELIYVLVVVVIYNHVLKEIPHPSYYFADYLQFGGTYSSLIDASTYWRYSVIGISLVGIWGIRLFAKPILKRFIIPNKHTEENLENQNRHFEE